MIGASRNCCRSFARTGMAQRALFGGLHGFELNTPQQGLFRLIPHSMKLQVRSYIPVDSQKKLAMMNAAKEKVDDDDQAAGGAVRPKLRVSDILDTMEHKNFTMLQSASVLDAISHLVTEKLASALVVNAESEILGIFTARDLLKCIQQHSLAPEFRHRSSSFLTEIKLKDIMTPKENLIHCSPSDSAKRCREIMFQCKIRNLPVIENGEVKGIITAKHLADASFNIKDTGGKKGFISNVTGRKGLPAGTKLNQDTQRQLKSSADQGATAGSHLDMEIASFALPHPFKRAEGVAMSRRLYGADELSTDMSLCEDAHFAMKVVDPLAQKSSATASTNSGGGGWGEPAPSAAAGNDATAPVDAASSHIYLCVADGVGSWRQFGVDPRQYSHRLVENARRVIESDMAHRELIRHSPFDRDLDPVHPLDVIMDAWNMTNSEGVVGSSTICVATLDKKLGQLSYCNIGDGGLLVVRHIDSDVVGYMRQTQEKARTGRSDLHIAYLSQQQLRSFNLPYQLGFTNLPDTPNSFESPLDADTASISVLPGDVIVLATDGLFDNMDLDDIVKEIDAWEKSDKVADVAALAEQLVQKARVLSLDKSRDSPFALLAKENDIMWGGGMPDDTSVVVARVTTVP